MIHVAHGKGDKSREVAIYGEEALRALRVWRRDLPADYRHVCVAFDDKSGAIGDDALASDTTLYELVRDTGERAGIGHLTPHDLRRALATELLATGTPVHEVQAQLGHRNAQTTLNSYALAVDARQRRRQGRLRFGD